MAGGEEQEGCWSSYYNKGEVGGESFSSRQMLRGCGPLSIEFL